jgi:hypothetical protein
MAVSGSGKYGVNRSQAGIKIISLLQTAKSKKVNRLQASIKKVCSPYT